MIWEKREAEGEMKNSVSPADYLDWARTATSFTADRDGPTCVDLAGTLIDLFPAGGDRSPMPGSGGQHHAYIIKLEDFDPWEAHFQAVGQKYRKTTHGMGRISLYVDDPDGYHIELTVPFADLAVGRAEIEKRGLLAEAMQPPPSFITRRP
jgi:hypothetical protein